MTGLLLLVAAYCTIGTLLYFKQDLLLYHPTPGSTPPAAKALDLEVEGARMRIWARPADGPAAVIYFGGNGEDVGGSFDALAAGLPGPALYLVNYRGYGGSTGTPSEAAFFADAQRVFDEAARTHPHVAVIGRSLGSGVATYLASTRPVERLVLVTPFDSIRNVAQGRFPMFPTKYLLRDGYDSAARVPQVRAPTLVIVAENDEVIPRARTDALIARFPPDQLQVQVIRGEGHNFPDTPEYLGTLRHFLSATQSP